MPNTRRACDKCYKYKEKCSFEIHTESCTQCERSASLCTTSRSRLRHGRRPQVKSLGPNGSIQVWDIKNTLVDSGTGQDTIADPARPFESAALVTSPPDTSLPYQTPTPCISNFQVRCAEDLLESSPWLVDRFSATYGIFMIGPSFGPGFRAAVQRSYACSPALLQEIYTVIVTIVECARHKIDLLDQADLAKGTTSLQKLRTARVARFQDASAVIALGQTMAAFELLTNCIGSMSILRYSLSSVQLWYGELAQDSLLDPVTITPIFWDTIYCLIKREIPVIKFLGRNSYVVDHVAGLCTTLLPILYDLCVVNATLKIQSQSGSQADVDALRNIEQRLLLWIPEVPVNFSSTFSSQEILGMKAQALMYQMTGLLIAHRILNPIGTQDDIAILYANRILSELSQYLASVGPGVQLPSVAFPILMAALEIPHTPKEIWKSITLLSAAPACAAKLSDVVEYVWMKRRCGFAGLIFDLVENGPAFTVVP